MQESTIICKGNLGHQLSQKAQAGPVCHKTCHRSFSSCPRGEGHKLQLQRGNHGYDSPDQAKCQDDAEGEHEACQGLGVLISRPVTCQPAHTRVRPNTKPPRVMQKSNRGSSKAEAGSKALKI